MKHLISSSSPLGLPIFLYKNRATLSSPSYIHHSISLCLVFFFFFFCSAIRNPKTKKETMRSSVLFYAGSEDFTNHHQSHFLEACCLCQKSLGKNNDIFMYRGNTPFCSQECRQEQIEIDEAQERRSWKLAKKALRQKAAAFATTETTEASEKSSRTGTVAVA